MSAGLVVVGGSYAALTIARCAREGGYAEPIVMISDELHLPYHRPPLSKGLLMGKIEQTSLPLQFGEFYREHSIEVSLGSRAVAIDRRAKQIEIEGGKHIAYERLALAVGARPRQLACPGAELAGIHYLRSLDDALSLREAAHGCTSVVIIGAGYIGLEVAASLSDGTRSVTVVELADRPLARVATPVLADFLTARHRKAGVRLMVRTGVEEVLGEGGKVKAVRCSDGSRLNADLVVVGAGVLPNIEIAQAAGVECGNGIAVDAAGRTSDPAIVSAGDCAVFDSRWGNCRLRLESVQNAFGQAEAAGAGIAGKAVSYDPVPWFWSDQYELKIQNVGLSAGHDDVVTRGDPESGRFSIYYLKQGRIIAVDSVNRPADHMLGRKLLAANVHATPGQLSDSGFDMKSLLPQVAPA
jgi:3-phenylpropionate/trans-cinnamate dioxygenase ferredoxin reductase subunit